MRDEDKTREQLVSELRELRQRIKELEAAETHRTRAEEKLRQQNEYLTVLHETALALMNRLELTDLLETIVTRAGALVGTSHGYIFLVEPGEAEMVVKVGVGACSEFIVSRLKPGEGLAGKVWQTGQPLAVEDYCTWSGRFPDPRLDIFHAAVAVPLKSGSKVRGVIGLTHLEKGRKFEDNEITVLCWFAQLASIALDNAHLSTSAQMELAERKRTEEILHEMNTVLENAVEGISRLDAQGRYVSVNKAYASITGYQPEEMIGMEWQKTVHPDDLEKMLDVQKTLLKEGKVKVEAKGLRKDGSVFYKELTLISNMDRNGQFKGHYCFMKDITERKDAEEALRKAYDELELRVEERTAELSKANAILKEQIAERKRVEEKLHQQNEYLTALHETTLGLMNRLELNDLLESIIARAAALIGTPQGFIALAKPGEDKITIQVSVGVDHSKFLGYQLKPGEGVIGKVWQTGQPLVVNDYRNWSGRLSEPRFNIFHAALGVPLKSGSQVVGVIGLGHLEEGRRFGEDEIKLLSRFAELASIALDNARLYTAAQQELAERKHVEEALRKQQEEQQIIFDSVPAMIWYKDKENRILRVNKPAAESTGLPVKEIEGKSAYELYPEEATQYYKDDLEVLNSGRPKFGIIEQLQTASGEKRWLQTDKIPYRDEKGNIVGVIVFARDITERKQVEEKLRQQNEYLTVLHETTLALMNRLELDDLLQAIVVRAGALVGTSHGFIRLIEQGETETVGKVGIGAFSPFIGQRRKLDEGLGGKVLQTGQILTVEDYKTWPHRLPDPRLDVFHAMIGIPLKSGSQVIGVIGLAYLEEGRRFGDNEIMILSRFAELASIALDNARLYAAVQQELMGRKRAEEALGQSEERYRAVVEQITEGIVLCDVQTKRVLESNAAFQNLLGYTAAEMLDLTLYDFIAHDRESIDRNIQRILVEKHYFAGERLYRRKDGSLIYVESSADLISYNKREVLCVVIRDITQRKKTEEVLAAEKERLAVTLRSIGDGVITTDTEGKIVLLNKVAEALTGWTQEEALGKPLDEVFHIVYEKTRERCENIVEKVLKTNGIVGLASHTALITREGMERIISSSGAPIRGKDGKIIGVVLVFRDITERRKLEGELLKAQKLESIGVLAGGIAHDFNNILTAILLNISLAKMETKPESDLFRRLIEAEKASLRAKDLTQQLLTFSKGGAPIKKTASIVELIKDSANFALRGSNVRCEFSITEDLWPVEVDEGQMSQVIHNLVLNAQQAMPGGGMIQVQAENKIIDSERGKDLPLPVGRYIKLSITDEGIGIPEEHLPKIFDPYFTTKPKGSGLGLATTYSIIKKHAGYIEVESKVGVGTTFYIYLPASKKEILTQEDRIKQDPKDQIKVSKGRVLIMDDEEMIREAVCQMLNEMGYEVEAARDGVEVIELYRRAKESNRPFQVVILDLTIPGGMGGKETMKRLTDLDPGIKVIVSSGYSNDPVMSEYQHYGFRGVITKPYQIEELNKTLQDIIMETNP